MKLKKVVYSIQYCNSLCPHFFRNYEDQDNIWCAKLRKKIYDYDGGMIFGDRAYRPLPKECPLEDCSGKSDTPHE